MVKALRHGWQALLDLLYPRACRACEEPLRAGCEDRDGDGLDEWLCHVCIDGLSRVEAPFCKVCGECYDGAITGEFRCANCADRKFAFEFAVSGFRAEGAVRDLIHRFKYGHDVTLRAVLGRMLQHSLDDPRLACESLAQWVLVPVPLHWSKRRARGFNQSLELCRVLTSRTRLATVDCLKRVRDTGSQAALHRNERLKNLRKAFSLRRGWFAHTAPDLKGAKVLLVDDVLTTGATTHECARILKRDCGVEKVVVITVARG